ncbi:MAG: hypothetical protein COA84_06895 [Robiginitomaculum sp.]|nr:MAG: hypothetical protein COA84_06895 [Robiginitomaculum sp.]
MTANQSNPQNSFKLSARSSERLAGVHKDLARVVRRALQLSAIDFTVLEGRRSIERQTQLYESGATRTLNSRHLSGHAVDLGAWVGGGVRWDWPLYETINQAMQLAATEQCVPVEWGGDWKNFKDGPHFQLPWDTYPILRQAQDEEIQNEGANQTPHGEPVEPCPSSILRQAQDEGTE